MLYVASVIGAKILFGKSMFSIFNASSNVVKIYKLWVLNNQTVAITGNVTTMQIWRTSASGGGTPLQTVKYDSTSPNISSQISITTGATDSLSELYRQILRCNDEPILTSAQVDETQVQSFYNAVIDFELLNEIIQPITIRQGEGITLYHSGGLAQSVGLVDIFCEFSITS